MFFFLNSCIPYKNAVDCICSAILCFFPVLSGSHSISVHRNLPHSLLHLHSTPLWVNFYSLFYQSPLLKHLSTFQHLFPLLLYGSLNGFSCDYRLNDRTLGFGVCGRFQFVVPFCLALPCLDPVFAKSGLPLRLTDSISFFRISLRP